MKLNRSQLIKFWWVVAITATFVSFFGGKWIGNEEFEDKYFTEDNYCGIILDNTEVNGYCIESDTSFPILGVGSNKDLVPVPVPTPIKNN